MKIIKYIILCTLVLLGGLTAPSSAKDISDSDFVDIVKDSVPRIIVQNKEGEVISAGSGFLIDSSGIVMTNAHVVSAKDGAHCGWCIFTFVNGDMMEFHCYKFDSFISGVERDVAYLYVPNMRFELPAPLCFCQEKPRMGDAVVAIGFPGNSDSQEKTRILLSLVGVLEQWYKEDCQDCQANNSEPPDYVKVNEAILQARMPSLSSSERKVILDFPHTVEFGQITSTREVDSANYGRVIQHSATISPGSSGGPLIDRKTGFVAGINTFSRLSSRAGGPERYCALSHVECRQFLKDAGVPIFEGNRYRYRDTMNAMRHFLGFSINRNPQRALEILQETANHKDSDAYSQFLLGMSYIFGEGGRVGNNKNPLIPIKYGFGCKRDIPEAIKYLSRSAELGLADAQFLLGVILCAESGDDENRLLIGKAWLKRAAAQKHQLAEEFLKKFSGGDK